MDVTRPAVLLSYWYGRTATAAWLDATGGVDVLIDSGAFSAHTSGATVDAGAYAAWLREWDGRAYAALNLDVIGDAAASARNHTELLAAALPMPVVPVFHAGQDVGTLDAVCSTSPGWVAFGGLVRVKDRRDAVARWCGYMERQARARGCRVHALGVAGLPLKHAPFWSADASTWTMAHRRGYLCLWDAGARMVRQAQIRSAGDRWRYRALIRANHLDPDRLAAPGYLRPGDPGYARDVAATRVVAVAAFARYGAWLTGHWAVDAPRCAPAAGVGTRMHFAVGSLADVPAVRAGYDVAAGRPLATVLDELMEGAG